MELSLSAAALSLEDKALRFHLAFLAGEFSKQRKEINDMVALHNKDECSIDAWDPVICSHNKLATCVSLFLKTKTLLTYMHIAVVSRLSDSYEYNLMAAKCYYNEEVKKVSLYRAAVTQHSAKYLAYAMIADRAGDPVLQNWCLKAADAVLKELSKDRYISRFMESHDKQYLARYRHHSCMAEVAVAKNNCLLASAHALLARNFKLYSAAVVHDCYTLRQYSYSSHYGSINAKSDKLLEEAEKLYVNNRVDAADALLSVILSHSPMNDIHVESSWIEVSHIFDSVLQYALGYDLPVPEAYSSYLDANLSILLWSRALSLPRNSLSEKVAQYAAELKHSIAGLDSHAKICLKKSDDNAVLGRQGCVEVWRHINHTVYALSKEIAMAATILNESEDGSGFLGWNEQKVKIKAIDDWIEVGDLLDETYARIDIYAAHRDRCELTSRRFPLEVRTVLTGIWDKVINDLFNGWQDLIAIIKVENRFVYPGDVREWKELCTRLSAEAHNCVLLATALHTEATRCADEARKAQLAGALSVAKMSAELACVAARYVKSKIGVINSQFWQFERAPFTAHEMQLLNNSFNNVNKAMDYFVGGNSCNDSTVSELWHELYEQQLLVCECCMCNVSTAAPAAAVKHLLLQIEQHSNEVSCSLLRSIQQLACQFAICVTKPKDRSVYWLCVARDACEQARKLLATSDPYSADTKRALQVSHATRLRCAAMCCDALASTTLTEENAAEPLVFSAMLLRVSEEGWDTCSKLCKYEEGIHFLNDTVIALLSGSPHADLVDVLRNAASTISEPLHDQVRALVEVNNELNNCAAAIVIAIAEGDENGVHLWRIAESVLNELKTLIFQHSLHLLDSSSPNVQSKFFQMKLRFQRVHLAALSYNNGESTISHCYEMASVTDVGSRQKLRHEQCMMRYLDIIDSAPSDDVALTALKVAAADCFRDLTDKNQNRRDEGVLIMLSKAADLLVDAYVAGLHGQHEKQTLLSQASTLLTEATTKSAHSKEAVALKKKADVILTSVDDVDGTSGDVNSSIKKKNGKKNKKK